MYQKSQYAVFFVFLVSLIAGGCATMQTSYGIQANIQSAVKRCEGKYTDAALQQYAAMEDRVLKYNNPQHTAEMYWAWGRCNLLKAMDTKDTRYLEQASRLSEKALTYLKEKNTLLHGRILSTKAFAQAGFGVVGDIGIKRETSIDAYVDAIAIFSRLEPSQSYTETLMSFSVTMMGFSAGSITDGSMERVTTTIQNALERLPQGDYGLWHSLLLQCLGQSYKVGRVAEKAEEMEGLSIAAFEASLPLLDAQKHQIIYYTAIFQLTATVNEFVGLREPDGKKATVSLVSGYLNKAVAAQKHAAEKLSAKQHPAKYASIMMNMGLSLRLLGLITKDNDYYVKAIPAFEAAGALFSPSEYPRKRSQVYMVMGRTHFLFAGTNTAEEYHLKEAVKALQVAMETIDPKQDPARYLKALSYQGQAYYSLELLLRADEYKDKEIDTYEKGGDICEAADNPKPCFKIIRRLGDAYFELHNRRDYDKYLRLAQAAYNKALKLPHDVTGEEETYMQKRLTFIKAELGQSSADD